MKRPRRQLDGVLLLDKAPGASSNDLLQKVKNLYRATKAGHTGALDPLASGLLPICFGESTKLSGILLDGSKSYRTVAKLGQTTTTSDAEGELLIERDVAVTQQQIEQALNSFKGETQQTPSIYSALKYQGKPLYYYARKGIDIPRKSREITITRLELISYQAPYLTLEVDCSKGTYIRTLVEDLGEVLGCGAHVSQLRRIAINGYQEDQAVTLLELQELVKANPESYATLDQLLLPVDSAAQEFPQLILDNQQARDLCQGRYLKLTEQQFAPEQLIRIYHPQLGFIGIAKFVDQLIRPFRLTSKTPELIAELDLLLKLAN